MLSLGDTQATVVQRLAAKAVVDSASTGHNPKISAIFFMLPLPQCKFDLGLGQCRGEYKQP
jgi:hypothetical protein